METRTDLPAVENTSEPKKPLYSNLLVQAAAPANDDPHKPADFVTSYEKAQSDDREKAQRARENAKTLTAAQIYAALTDHQKHELFSHYMMNLSTAIQALKQNHTPYADTAVEMQKQILRAYNDRTFADSHLPNKQDLTNLTQKLVVLLETPHVVDGQLNPDLVSRIREIDNLSKVYRTSAGSEIIVGILNLLLTAIAAAALLAISVMSLGTLTLPTMACVIGIWALLGGVTGCALTIGVTGSAALFHDARRNTWLSNGLQPLTQAMNEHHAPVAPRR